ncbi:hypothetical protein V5799_026676 [Amblyomma americanum]|uniref:Uncharacterized protein n=1 Tax=Amblyomma americanum TaxID=6943 RepID=A0AAQ4DHW6_AMBAM
MSEAAFRLPANADASVLKKHLDTQGTALLRLSLTNCLVADVKELCRLAGRCEKLHTLDCIGCPLKAVDLLRLLLGPLKKLTHLKFSLQAYESILGQLLKYLGQVTGGELRKHKACNVRRMYVEVVGDPSVVVLEAFLGYCPNVTDLHVHLASGSINNAVWRCAQILGSRSRMEAFVLTSEVECMAPREVPAVPAFENCAPVRASAIYRCQDNSWNCAWLRDLATSAKSSPLSEPLIVVAMNQSKLPQQIHDASWHNNWSDLRTFCLILSSPPEVEGILHATAEAACNVPLQNLFAECKNLIELNVSSFHSGHDLDLSEVLGAPALRQLQALSLAPCGLRYGGAVERLAQHCPNIEDLDVRYFSNDGNTVCIFCEEELRFSPDEAANLSVSRSNGRLTLDHVPRMESLKFLASCMVAELRILDYSPTPLRQFEHLGQLLKFNSSLRTLVLRYEGLFFTSIMFQRDIMNATKLRYLCVLSDEQLNSSTAESVVGNLGYSLPRLEAFHAHYKTREKITKKVTWLRAASSPDQLEGVAAAAPGTAPWTRHGYLLHGKPCILCWTQTFIGLLKPHNRGRMTSL